MARILAVDDTAETLIIVRKTLSSLGHQVVTCADAEDALKRLGGETFDLILLDIMMPKVDGLELCRRIRQAGANREAKIVIFSAKSDSELIDLARRFGADYYLGKPAQITKIQQVVTRLLENA